MKKRNLESLSQKSISGWIEPNADGSPTALLLKINEQSLGTYTASGFREDLKRVVPDGKCQFKIGLRLDDERFLKYVPQNAVLRLIDQETNETVVEQALAGGQSQGELFANEFGESYISYGKGEGFIIPLANRTEEWWDSVLNASERFFEKARAAGYDAQIAYGALLGNIREKSFVPHDDDIDITLNCGETEDMVKASLEFSRRLEQISGSAVRKASNGQAHVHFREFARPVTIDVFAAWTHAGKYYQNFTIAGNLPASDVYPSVETDSMGRTFPIPRNAENMLEAIYGPGWKVPDPGFKWQRPKKVSEYFSLLHNYNQQANKDYWEGYYGRQKEKAKAFPTPPSQFSTFATDFLDRDDLIVEFGCGNARDSLFFSSYGWQVLASDYSREAVNENTRKAEAAGNDKVHFEVCNVADIASMNAFLSKAEEQSSGRKVFYSRFFLHAIAVAADRNMRGMIDRYAKPGDLMLCETRVAGDEKRPKVTPEHFRRVVNGKATIAAWEALGWTLEYTVRGIGFAKYKEDDALVRRFVMKKT